MIFESLFKALATELSPFDFGGIGRHLPDGRERRSFGLLRKLAGRDIDNHGGVPRPAICILAK
jgi:hypothetical protein